MTSPHGAGAGRYVAGSSDAEPIDRTIETFIEANDDSRGAVRRRVPVRVAPGFRGFGAIGWVWTLFMLFVLALIVYGTSLAWTLKL